MGNKWRMVWDIGWNTIGGLIAIVYANNYLKKLMVMEGK